jgi:hypothetical protein
MTMLFAPCVGVTCAGAPQEVRRRRNTPAKSETGHFFMLTTFPVLDLLGLKITSTRQSIDTKDTLPINYYFAADSS